MSDEEKRSSARNPTAAINDKQRKLISSAIIEGLVTPGSFTFTNPIATEGGDYNQNGGGYTQSGGGNHNQGGGGGYNQSALTGNFGDLDVTNIGDILRGLDRFRR